MTEMFLVSVNGDLTEGRGPMIPYCVCDNMFLANTIKDWLVTNIYYNWDWVVDIKPILMPANAVEICQLETEKIREKALKKLSSTERKILGLE